MMNAKELTKIILEQYNNIAGIIIIKDDKNLYENYFYDSNKDETIHIASVTKSIISILIGIAIDKGLIKSTKQKVLEYFPEYKIKRGEKKLQEVTIKDLLTMTAPYKYKYEPYTKVYSSNDWTKAVLDLLGGKGQIGKFKYTTIGIQVLSGILAKATGKSILQFANENLFEPIGIKSTHNVQINNKEEHFSFLKDKYINGWVIDPKGINTAGWGLTLSTNDILKLGQLCLNKGLWKNKQIISSKWIEESTKKHSQWKELSYGYLWWIIDDDTYAAIGDGGNIIYVSTKNKLVVAITSRFEPRAKDRVNFIKNYIEPLF